MSGLEMKYFVLKPHGDSPYAVASRDAMLSYAMSIRSENEELASDLENWVQQEIAIANEKFNYRGSN